MDGAILLKEFNNFEVHVNGLRAPNYVHNDYDGKVTTDEMEDIEVKLEDLHHSIEIKEEYQQDSNQEIPHHANSPVQIKTEEEIEFKLENLHHSIDIKEETSVLESQSNKERKPHTTGKKFVHKSIYFGTGTGKKIYPYEIYNNKHAQRGQLNVHLLSHTGEKPFACEICDFKFNSNGSLKIHLLSHTGEKCYACKICNFKCNFKGSLKRHLLTHAGEKRSECNICGYKFSGKRNFKNHIV